MLYRYRRTISLASLAIAVGLAATGSLTARAAGATSGDAVYARLQTLAREMTFAWAKAHPLVATSEGLRDEDGRLADPSADSRARDLASIRAWRTTLAAIPLRDATLVERDDAKLLGARLTRMERTLTVYAADRKDYSASGRSVVDALFTQFTQLPVAGTDGAVAADVTLAWDRIIARLAATPRFIAASEKLVTEPGHLYGIVGAQELAGAPSFLDGALTDAAKAQLPAATFARFATARDAASAAIASEKAYIDAHVANWPENYVMGRAAYDAMLRDEQLLPYTTQDIERIANDELARGWAQQAWDQNLAVRRGTPIGVASGGGIAPGGPALIDYYRDRIAELTAFMRDARVIDIPAWLGQVRVVETPAFLQPVSPGASMQEPLLFSTSATGFYFITPPKSLEEAARTLDPNEDFDRDRILETAAHEAMPGHFLQGSIARRHPDFVRKTTDSGVFAEGWAFYGEEMFWQLGLYGDHDVDARYDAAQWERVRGARAIVDAELASGDWSFDRAVTFFAAQTGFPAAAAKAAVADIALGPGYVISYSVGRLQLETLLGDYLARAGANASLLDFDDRLMCYGTTPFAIVGPELLADLDKPLAAVRAAADF